MPGVYLRLRTMKEESSSAIIRLYDKTELLIRRDSDGIFAIDQLPKITSGKIRRVDLRNWENNE